MGFKTMKLSKLTHNLWAQTIHIKEHSPWLYLDNLCVCEVKTETQRHIFYCDVLKYKNEMTFENLKYNNLYF